MVELNKNMKLNDKYGGGIYIRDKVLFNSWNINKTTVLETPLSVGNTSCCGISQFDVGNIGAFTYIMVNLIIDTNIRQQILKLQVLVDFV